MANYYLLYPTENGASLVKYTKRELEEALRTKDVTESLIASLIRVAEIDRAEFAFRTEKEIPLAPKLGIDLNALEHTCILIKGEVVVPTPKEQVTVWDVE